MTKDFETCEGGCTCGQVRYKVEIAPLVVHACHCRWCQRQTGGPHVINALYESDFVEVTEGEVEEIKVPSPSGEGQVIARCPACKVAVWSNYLASGMGTHIRFLRVGSLDNPDRIPPDVHIFTSTKMPWYVIPETHLSVDEFYDLDATWSDASKERLQTLKDKVA